MKRDVFSKSFWIFLAIGLLVRAWNLPGPIVDSIAPRQAQTADAIRSMIEEPGFQLDANASWRGTSGARIVLELPIYNVMTQVVYTVLDAVFYQTNPPKPGGADPQLIDISGRLVSLGFWSIVFVFAQFLWVRFLNPLETALANGILIFAPLSVFCGQSLSPEMVLLALATGFVVAVLRYAETPTLVRFLPVFVCALLACLIKLPAFSHLAVLGISLLWRKRGFAFLFRPAHLVAAVIVLVALKVWGIYVTEVNQDAFPLWTSESSLRLFLGDPMERFRTGLYIKIAAYVTVFILTPLGVLFAAKGLFEAWRRRTDDVGFFILMWVVSLSLFVVIWGPATAGAHNYYNLPFLIPGALLFGLGSGAAIRWAQGKWNHRIAAGLMVAACLLIIMPMCGASAYLFRQENIMMTAAAWIRDCVPQGRPVAVKLNHNPHYIDYYHVPSVSYYSGHPCFMLSRYLPEDEYAAAMNECEFIVETLPAKDSMIKRLVIKAKGSEREIDQLNRAKEAGFSPWKSIGDELRIWKKEM